MIVSGPPLAQLRVGHTDLANVTHEDPVVAALLARYTALLDTSTSVLIHGQQRPTSALSDFIRQANHGVITSDLSTAFVEAHSANDSRASTRDYGYTAFCTSGTSGQSKAVLYSKTTLLACAHAIGSTLALSKPDCAVSYVRPNLAYGLSIVHSHYLAQSRVQFRYNVADPYALQRDIASLPDPCAVYLLPIQAIQLTYGTSAQPATRSIDFRIAGALLPSTVAEKLYDRYPNAVLTNMYGQSELGPRISTWRGRIGDYVEGLVGQPLAGVSIHIDSGSEGPGLIWVMSPYRMLRYLGRPPSDVEDLDASRLQWLQTGDLGYVTALGDLVLTGRGSRQLNIGGELIPISAIVSAVRSLDSVGTCRVTADKHPALGEIALIWIVPSSDGLTTGEIVRSVRMRLRERLGRAAALSRVRITTDARHGKL